MTATRWWVRAGARWLARVDGVSDHLRLAMLGLTGVSTTIVALRDYGYSEYAGPFIVVVGLLGLVFAYLYTEGGVWNQMARDRQDMSANFASPKERINTEMGARAFIAALQGRPLSDEQLKALDEELDMAFEELSDGVELDDYER